MVYRWPIRRLLECLQAIEVEHGMKMHKLCERCGFEYDRSLFSSAKCVVCGEPDGAIRKDDKNHFLYKIGLFHKTVEVRLAVAVAASVGLGLQFLYPLPDSWGRFGALIVGFCAVSALSTAQGLRVLDVRAMACVVLIPLSIVPGVAVLLAASLHYQCARCLASYGAPVGILPLRYLCALRPAMRRFCGRCRYDLQGLSSSKCPECGSSRSGG